MNNRSVPMENAARERGKMEKAREFLKPRLSQQESDAVSRIHSIPSIRPGDNSSFYEHFILTGIRVDRVEPGFVSCSFKVPPHLTDKNGKLVNGAIANLVDEVGGAVVHAEGLPMNVSVDMSISILSTAHFNDELEITSRLLGRKGGYSGTIVLLKNKATGELIAEGRHSLFGRHNSKIGGFGQRRLKQKLKEGEECVLLKMVTTHSVSRKCTLEALAKRFAAEFLLIQNKTKSTIINEVKDAKPPSSISIPVLSSSDVSSAHFCCQS